MHIPAPSIACALFRGRNKSQEKGRGALKTDGAIQHLKALVGFRDLKSRPFFETDFLFTPARFSFLSANLDFFAVSFPLFVDPFRFLAGPLNGLCRLGDVCEG